MAVPRPTAKTRRPRPGLTAKEALWGGLALLLVPVYVNAIVVWRWLEASLSDAVLAAVPLLLVLALAVILWLRHRPRLTVRPRHAAVWLSVACLLAATVWLLVDSRFPAKRVHLFEYALLALIVRQFFHQRLEEPVRTIAGVLIAGILGLHDELLQGLHAGRYFSPMDVAVNVISAGAGGALAYAFHGTAADEPCAHVVKRADWTVMAASLVGLAGFVYCLAVAGAVRSNAVGLGLPLLGLVAWFSLSRGDPIGEGGPRFVATVVGLSTAAIAAPIIAILFDLPFA